MDKYYFLLKGNDKIGPFNFEQLKNQQLLADDLVWCTDFGDAWKRVDEIDSLKNNYIQTPPPSPVDNIIKRRKKDIITILFFFLATFIIIGIISFGALYDWLLYSVKHRYKNEVSDVFVYAFLYLSIPLSVVITSIKYSAIIKKYLG